MSVSKSKRFKVFDRDGYKCRYCGRTPEDSITLEVDHVIPRARGGGDEIENLVSSCFDCNRGKSAISIGSVAPESESDKMRRLQEIAEIQRAAIEVKELADAKQQRQQEWVNAICDAMELSTVRMGFVAAAMRLAPEFGNEKVLEWAEIVGDKFTFTCEYDWTSATRYLYGIARKTRETQLREVPHA